MADDVCDIMKTLRWQTLGNSNCNKRLLRPRYNLCKCPFACKPTRPIRLLIKLSCITYKSRGQYNSFESINVSLELWM